MIDCPACSDGKVPRIELYRSDVDVGLNCPSCGAKIRVRSWVRRLPDGLGGLLVPFALVMTVMTWSWVPFALLFLVTGFAHCLVYWSMGSLLEKPRS